MYKWLVKHYYILVIALLIVLAAYLYYKDNATEVKALIGADMNGLIYQEKVKENAPEFLAEVKNVAKRLAVNPNWIMAVMQKESGLNHRAVNAQKGDKTDAYSRAATRATGLIQFMPDTARSLGTNNQQIYLMSNVAQLALVEKFYRSYQSYLKSYPDMYLATFYPAALSKPQSFVIGSEVSPLRVKQIADQNPAISQGKPQITKADFYAYVWRGINENLKPYLQ